MFEVLKPLIDHSLISEETHQEIKEAWKTQLTEATEMAKAELREEFAQRYEHDKLQLVEALDSMVADSLTKEIVDFVEDKKAVVEQAVAYRTAISKHADKLDAFVTKNLVKEMKEFHNERNIQTNSFAKLESFIIKSLSEEIAEFNNDKQDVVATKVRLVRDAKVKLDELKTRFIKRSAKLVEETVTKTINDELCQLKEDIIQARNNQFGREIFEAFAAEYTTSQLNEGTLVAKLQRVNSAIAERLVKANTQLKEKKNLVETRDSQIRIIKDNATRKDVMSEMLASLAKNNQVVMSDLLENVKTENLKTAFEKYLPSVLNETVQKKSCNLNESKTIYRKAITGNRKKVIKEMNNDNLAPDEVQLMLNLAGLDK